MTLLEIMIVIFLIGLIGSVIGYNMKGSLDEGRAFKSKQGAQQIRDILDLEVAKGVSPQEVAGNPEKYLRNSGMAKDPKKMLRDGWDELFDITATNKGTISVLSKKLKNYETGKRKKLNKPEPTLEEQEDSEEF